MNVFGITIAACLCFYLSTRQTKFPTCDVCLNICIRCKKLFYTSDNKKVVPSNSESLNQSAVINPSNESKQEERDLESENKIIHNDNSKFESMIPLMGRMDSEFQYKYHHLEDADSMDEMYRNNKKWKKFSERILIVSKVLAVVIFPTSILVLSKVFGMI